MRTSDQTNEIAKALAAAQAEMQNATPNKENSHFHNKYADMAAIRDAVVPALSKNGIAVTQATAYDADGFRLVTRLTHLSGQWLEGTYPLAAQGNAQALGSQLTYARRYALSSMCAISSEEDDDAELSTTESKRDIGTPRSTKTVANGGQKSAYQARKDGDFPALQQEMQSQPDRDSLIHWYKSNKERITKMPANWQDEFHAIYDDRLMSFPREPAITGA